MMPAAAAKTGLPPRMLSRAELAAYLGHGPAAFARLLHELYEIGLPSPDITLQRWDRVAVDEWLDSIGGGRRTMVIVPPPDNPAVVFRG